MSKNKIKNQKTILNWIRTFAAVMLIAGMAMAAVVPVEAAGVSTYTTYAIYGHKIVWIGYTPHYVIPYKVPRQTISFPLKGSDPCPSLCYRPAVWGVDYSVLLTLPDHTDPQKWDYYRRYQIDASWDMVELLVPKTYALKEIAKGNLGWAGDIYITVYWR